MTTILLLLSCADGVLSSSATEYPCVDVYSANDQGQAESYVANDVPAEVMVMAYEVTSVKEGMELWEPSEFWRTDEDEVIVSVRNVGGRCVVVGF
jgi:hypothetical protein